GARAGGAAERLLVDGELGDAESGPSRSNVPPRGAAHDLLAGAATAAARRVQCRVLPQDDPQAAPVLQVCTQPVAGSQLSAAAALLPRGGGPRDPDAAG